MEAESDFAADWPSTLDYKDQGRLPEEVLLRPQKQSRRVRQHEQLEANAGHNSATIATGQDPSTSSSTSMFDYKDQGRTYNHSSVEQGPGGGGTSDGDRSSSASHGQPRAPAPPVRVHDSDDPVIANAVPVLSDFPDQGNNGSICSSDKCSGNKRMIWIFVAVVIVLGLLGIGAVFVLGDDDTSSDTGPADIKSPPISEGSTDPPTQFPTAAEKDGSNSPTPPKPALDGVTNTPVSTTTTTNPLPSTFSPSMKPTITPTFPRTKTPTKKPSVSPTRAPTRAPSLPPTRAPSVPTGIPTSRPTIKPTLYPTLPPVAPTQTPTRAPSLPLSPTTERPPLPGFGDWTLLGAGLEGELTNDNLGSQMALSGDGFTIAGGGSNFSPSRIFTYNIASDRWEKLGQDIFLDSSAQPTIGNSLSPNGRIFAATTSTMARVFEYNANQDRWIQMGQDIQVATVSVPAFALLRNGRSLSLHGTSFFHYNGATGLWEEETLANAPFDDFALSSDDGNTVAVFSAEENAVSFFTRTSDNGSWTQLGQQIMSPTRFFLSPSGRVMAIEEASRYLVVYEYVSDRQRWLPLGTNVDRYVGEQVKLSSNGRRLVTANSSYGYIYEYTGNAWMQTKYALGSRDVAMSSDGRIAVLADREFDTATASNAGRMEVFAK